jgi:uncharacterized protein (TIGR02145 family)
VKIVRTWLSKTFKFRIPLLLITVVLGACKNDEPAPDVSLKLIGAWELVRFVASNCTDPSDNEDTRCTSKCEKLVITASTITMVGEGKYTYKVSFVEGWNANLLTISIAGSPRTVAFEVSDTELILTHQDTPADGNCKSESTYKRYDDSVKDIDGNVYKTIFIGEQEWMKENLKAKRFNDGTQIPNVTQAGDWVNRTTPAYSDYENSESNATTYGRLYNLYAVSGNQNVCPTGWHVPSLNEWNVLINTLGGESIAGGKMKVVGNSQVTGGLWNPPNEGATNESEFSALPAGTRFDVGDFRDLHGFAHFRASDGWNIRVQSSNTAVEFFFNYPTNGSSVRCVRN